MTWSTTVLAIVSALIATVPADESAGEAVQLPAPPPETQRQIQFPVPQPQTFEIPGDDQPASQAVTVVLETSLGSITIALDMENAPITSANFLAYIDEDRLDGTVFYRAFTADWGEQPNGFIQGGARNHPERVLDPIAHEPTSETGLTHTRGAISMARGEPGTATGDFFIIVGTQTGLDANPEAEDPQWRDGYAVFGTVIAGMEVVDMIHTQATDPDLGEGILRGQMLAAPVTIIDARRAPTPPVESSAD